MIRSQLTLAGAAAGFALCPALATQEPESVAIPEIVPVVSEPSAMQARQVDLAICLDTSGSMDGLIESAKQKIWAIVNDLALAEPTPQLRVALLTFGNDGHNAENGWVRVDAPLTEDLDLISERLFALTTNGGTEYVGRVLNASLHDLEWTESDDALKLIVVAGNEAADQDPEFDFREVCKAAITNGIMVNSIYCGDVADQLAPVWREVASRADGHFASIDTKNGPIAIETPFDAQLASLSSDLNGTYIPVGQVGAMNQQRQRVQDENAANCNTGVVAQRAWSKANGIYVCADWDLVDGCEAGTFDLETIAIEELPENMQAMTLEERKAYVTAQKTKRGEIQSQIADLNTKREAFVNEERQKNALDDSAAFDQAVRKAIRSQARSKGFQYAEAEAVAPAATASGATEAPAPAPAPSARVEAPAPAPAPAPQTIGSQQLRGC